MINVGDKIGPYTLIELIGRGGFGSVWLAERKTSLVSIRVVLKVLHVMEGMWEFVRGEALAWASASGHPNILSLIEAEIYDGQPIIATEYVPDGSLYDWLRRHDGKAPSVEVAVEMILGILSGLSHLHSRRIIHRDVKPANVLLHGQMPRLADFGIARLLEEVKEEEVIAGTPLYMAPEAFEGKISEQTDIYSVGVVLYQMVSGQLPHTSTNFSSIVSSALLEKPKPLPPDIPEEIQKVIFCALEKDPSHRYKSAEEMQLALKKALRLVKYTDTKNTVTSNTHEPFYDLAISFAGEDREVAEEIANELKAKGARVFYDKYEQANLWGKDLFTHLNEVYSKRAHYCLILISEHYAKKQWTNHERKAAQSRAFSNNEEYILPLKLDDTEIPGLLPTVGYIDLRHSSLNEVVQLLIQKLQL